MIHTNEIANLLAGYHPVTLEEVRRAVLMRRRDNKYLFPIALLPALLSGTGGEYLVLDIDGNRSHGYRTRYYDTQNLEMYHMHHRGAANRHKIRFREYATSRIHYLEVKRKNTKGITIKNRVKTDGMDPSHISTQEKFLSAYSPYLPDQVAYVLENRFSRITLIRRDRSERITIDYDLQFSRQEPGQELGLPGVSIAEIKYENHLGSSPFLATLRKNHVMPMRFSKYAIGMALMNRDLKQNRFKERIRRLYKINEQSIKTA